MMDIAWDMEDTELQQANEAAREEGKRAGRLRNGQIYTYTPIPRNYEDDWDDYRFGPTEAPKKGGDGNHGNLAG